MIDSIIKFVISRSREGAWIEIATAITINQFREGRSREGAWIEIVAVERSKVGFWSLPRGSVD